MDDEENRLEEILNQDNKSTDSLAGTDSGQAEDKQAPPANDSKDDIEEAIRFAKKYIEDLLSFFGLNTDVYATTEDHEVIELDIPSTHLNGFLIGQRGETMRALQYTISNALKAQGFSHTRINVDVADYKRHRAQRVADKAEDWFKEVRDSGKPKELPPMNAADRRVVHKAASEYGLETESVGAGPERHIVLQPTENKAIPPPTPSVNT